MRISAFYNTYAAGAKNVTILDSSFYRNGNTNLEIHNSGVVKITNLRSIFSQAGGMGLYVNNTYAVSPAPVTILGAVLSDNSYRGGTVTSKGTITVRGITANRNNGNGLYLENHVTGAAGSVIVLGSLGLNQFNNNSGAGCGLNIFTDKNVNLASIQANGNSAYGIYVNGNGDNSSARLVNVEAAENLLAGVRIYTSGAVTLSKVFASENAGDGIYIDNDGATFARSVVINSSSANNSGNYGIYVRSVGIITLKGVTASGNTLNGANLANTAITLPTQVPQGITVLKSTFDNNLAHGLYLETLRKITLVSNNASRNTSFGVYVLNQLSTVSSPVVVSGVNHFNFNGGSGLYINSSGALAISGVAAAGNSLDGIYAFTTSGATLKNSQMEGNTYWGVYLNTNSTTNLSGLTVLQNGFVTDYPGINVVSTGKVFISSSMVMGNSGWGLLINVTNPLTDCKIAPNVVVIGNDAGPTYDDGNVLVY